MKKMIDATTRKERKTYEPKFASFVAMPDGTVKMRESNSLHLTKSELSEIKGE